LPSLRTFRPRNRWSSKCLITGSRSFTSLFLQTRVLIEINLISRIDTNRSIKRNSRISSGERRRGVQDRRREAPGRICGVSVGTRGSLSRSRGQLRASDGRRQIRHPFSSADFWRGFVDLESTVLEGNFTHTQSLPQSVSGWRGRRARGRRGRRGGWRGRGRRRRASTAPASERRSRLRPAGSGRWCTTR
jgi:hypothetical protein